MKKARKIRSKTVRKNKVQNLKHDFPEIKTKNDCSFEF